MKGQICTGPECDREQMLRLDVCKSHRSQQLKGLSLFPLGKYRPKTVQKPECSYNGCDRPCTGRQTLCKAHHHQAYTGRPLRPLRGQPKVLTECRLVFCDRKPARRKSGLCPAHHESQRHGRTLKPIEHQGQQQPPCRLDGCDNPQLVRFDLCKRHRGLQRAGRPLTRPVAEKTPEGIIIRDVIKPPKKRRYGPDDTCAYEPCGKRPVSNELCSGHDWQQRKHGELWPIGERRKVDKGFSETMKCDTCKERKKWTAFVIGAENKKNECRECYRKRILPPREEKKPVDTDSLLSILFGDVTK